LNNSVNKVARKIAMPPIGGVGILCCFLGSGLSVKPIFSAHGHKTRIKIIVANKDVKNRFEIIAVILDSNDYLIAICFRETLYNSTRYYFLLCTGLLRRIRESCFFQAVHSVLLAHMYISLYENRLKD